MTGGSSVWSRRRLKHAHGAGIGALLFLIALVVYFGVVDVPGTSFLPISLPTQFWTVILLVIALGLVAHVYRLEHALQRARRVLAARNGDADEPMLRPNGSDDPLDEELGDPRPGRSAGTPARVAASTLPQLLDWIDGVGTKISEWSSSVGNSLRGRSQDPDDPLADSTGPSMKTSAPRVGGWTELRARTEIARYLRKRPWAPAKDVARALGMDVGLATRVSETLREEMPR